MSLNERNRPHARTLWPSAAQTAAIALLGSCLALSQAFGQAQPPASNAPSASPAAISDQKIKAAASAIPQVEGIRQNYQQQIAKAPDGDKPRLENQAGDEMKKAITDQGLSIADYNSVLAMVTLGHFFDIGAGPSLDFLAVANESGTISIAGLQGTNTSSSGISAGAHARIAFNIGGLNGNGPRRSGFAIGFDAHPLFTGAGKGVSLTAGLGAEWY